MKENKVIRTVLAIILIILITYFGGGDKFLNRLGASIGEKVSEKITGEPVSEEQGKLVGQIIYVSDGDTMTLKDNDGKQHKVRLNGIDCPEIGQEYGDEARDYVKKIALKKYAVVEVVDIDQYDRTLGVLYIDELNVNEALLENGLAWQYRYNKDEGYARLVHDAKRENLNIWSNPNSLNPYVYRKQHGK